MNTIFRLSLYLNGLDQRQRSHFYRYRSLLKEKCSEVSLHPKIALQTKCKLFSQLALFGPLEPRDLADQDSKQLLAILNQCFPRDPKFYRSLLSQLSLWESCSEETLQSFLESDKGYQWTLQRTKMKRPALYELDLPYKRSKIPALENLQKGREILREQPFLRLEDLRQLGIRSPQKLLEGFPQLELHRQKKLKEIRKSLR